MLGRIPDSFIDDLLTRIDIVEIIEARVPLRKAGRDYSGRCPFHDERSPSFTVSPAKQFYHCFGCGAHGSAIKFLMEYDRLEFVDAVEELAHRVGVKVPYEGAGRAPQVQDSVDLYELLNAAAKFYAGELAKSDKARAYFEQRGLDETTIARFGLGYAPDQWDALKSVLGSTPQRAGLLEKSGMLIAGERGSKYDRFRDRVMFPIQDRRGRVIAFGGRVLGEGTPKYLNSPETPLFHKGQELFALWQVRQVHSKIPRLLVVEGYMDVIALFQYGLTQAVATLGTATTRDHAELLFRNCSDVYFCFDGDRAGRSAAWRAVESVLPRLRDGRQAYFLFLPEGEDPDSLIRQEGLAGFEQRLAVAMPLSEFFFSHQEAETNLGTADGRARLAERCKEQLSSIPEGAFRDRMYEMLVEKTTIKWAFAPTLSIGMRSDAEALIEDRLSVMKGTPASTVKSPQIATSISRKTSVASRSLVRTVIALLLQQPRLAQALQSPYIFSILDKPGIPLLMELIELCTRRPEISTGALLEHFSERTESAALQKLAMMDFPGGEDEQRAEFLDALDQLNRQTTAQRIETLTGKRAHTALSNIEKEELRELLTQKATDHKQR